MNHWCRLCKKWVYQEHFLLPNGRWDACGQGRPDLRYHVTNPLCGDVWKLKDGRYMVVDYIDSFQVGVTWDDGKRGAVNYRDAFEMHVRGGQLISTFEETPYIACDHKGWTRPTDKVPVEGSLAFLRSILAKQTKGE